MPAPDVYKRQDPRGSGVEVADIPGEGIATLGHSTSARYQCCTSGQHIGHDGAVEVDLAVVVALVRAGFVHHQVVSYIAAQGHDVLATVVLRVPGQTRYTFADGKRIIGRSSSRNKIGANFGLVFGF